MIEIFTDKPGKPQVLYEFLAEKTGMPWSTDLRVIGTLRETPTGLVPAAVFGYTAWVGDGVFGHVAFEDPRALTKTLLREAFKYAFVTCGRRVIYGQTLITAEAVIKFALRLGFREVYRNDNFVLFEMTAKECRWLDESQRRRSGST